MQVIRMVARNFQTILREKKNNLVLLYVGFEPGQYDPHSVSPPQPKSLPEVAHFQVLEMSNPKKRILASLLSPKFNSTVFYPVGKFSFFLTKSLSWFVKSLL